MEQNDKFHLLDEYLMGRLQGAEKIQFEQMLRSDPSLARQADIQSDVLNGIGEARKKELKARLAAIPLPSAAAGGAGAGLSNISTWVYVGAAAFLIGTGVLVGNYFSANTKQENKPAQIENKLPIEDNQAELQASETVQATEAIEQIEKPAKANNATNEVSKGVAAESKTKKASVPTNREPKESNSMPSASEPMVNDVDLKTASSHFGEESNEVDNAANPVLGTNAANSVASNVETEFNKNYPFHYKNSNGRLTLSGDFKGKPYELLEIKNSKGINYYLKYEGNFYLIENNKEQFTKLQLLDDKQIINQLNTLQKRK